MTSEINEPIIDLSLRKFTHIDGDVTVIGTWLLTNKHKALVLVPTYAKSLTHDRIVPCIVPEPIAYIWDERTGDGRECAATAFQFAAALGMNPNNPLNVIRVASIIRNRLGDLVLMGPMPDSENYVAADAIITDRDSGKSREVEIVDHV